MNVQNGLGKIKLDEWKGNKGATTLDYIRAVTNAYLEDKEVQIEIRKTAKRLVDIRRARSMADIDQWERFCHGVQYVCPLLQCHHGGRPFSTRESFKSHIQEDHLANRSEDELGAILDEGKRFLLFPYDKLPDDLSLPR